MIDGENHDQHDDGLSRGWTWTTLGEVVQEMEAALEQFAAVAEGLAE